MSNEDFFVANGINGSTGEYGQEGLTLDDMADAILGAKEPKNQYLIEKHGEESALIKKMIEERLLELRAKQKKEGATPELDKQIAELEKELKKRDGREVLGVAESVKDPTDLAQAGWGIIFADNADPAIKEALSELIDLRRQQASKDNELYFKVFEGADGYRVGTGQTYSEWARVGFGPVNPDNGVPYYLLIVGDPADIPYSFQYQLDVQFAVGRVHFDRLEDYARYARSVVLAETGQVSLPRQAAFLGVNNDHDRPTDMSTKHLITPLHQRFTETQTDWEHNLLLDDQAGKATLSGLLNGRQLPAILFTASHGMEFQPDESRHLPHQGALLCQDWPGPRRWRQAIPEDYYLSADDIESQANLLGLMAFFFACYGAGTPQFDEFAELRSQPRQIAEKPFVAALPKKMLSQGSLAVVGHIERAWGYSFFWPGAGEQLAVFRSTLMRLMKKMPIGLAMEYFNERYAELAAALVPEITRVDAGYAPNNMVNMWTAHNDARNYVVLGDPAARLPLVDNGSAQAVRPELGPISVKEPEPSKYATLGVPDEPHAKPEDEPPIPGINPTDWQNTPPPVQEMLQAYFKKHGPLK